MTEEWRKIPSAPNYSVSSEGRVRREVGGRGSRAGLILKTRPNIYGYALVSLHHNDQRRMTLVSRLVCEAFHGPAPTAEHQAAHGDGDRANNRPGNLRWATKRENETDKIAHGSIMRGTDHPNSRLSDEAVRAIRSDKRSQRLIAAEHNVSQALVSMVRNRVAWAHIE